MVSHRRTVVFRAAYILALLIAVRAAAQPSLPYAVQISASPQESPPVLLLQWTPDPGALSYTIYRKGKSDTDWGAPRARLPGSSRSLADPAVETGTAYEYQIVKEGSGYTGYGYIYCGIDVPAIEDRGKLVLIVERSATAPLWAELERLERDLVGDGWEVLRHDVSSNDTPASVRQLIKGDYAADPGRVAAVFLFGHVPIMQAGNIDYDGHGAHPMPWDAYYGDMNDRWPASVIDPNLLPSDVELMVGRVDLSNLPGGDWPSETELLRNYLEKDHAWRHKQVTVGRRALIGDRFETFDGEAFAATGWRNFGPFVGSAQTETADVTTASANPSRWITRLASGTYLWAYGCGGGDVASIAWLGTHDPYQTMFSTDLVGQDAKAVFFLLFGSNFGRWDYGANNILRAALATPSLGLASCLAGRPHWFFHHMGLGEPIGYSARLTMNNTTLYRNEKNEFTRSVHIALMGDPTLRLDVVAPPCGLDVGRTSGGYLLRWCPSADAVAGYHVYRATSPAGPFTRVSQSPITEITFQDSLPASTPAVYMVRAVALENHFSGSYYDLSQGVFGGAGNGLGLGITRVGDGFRLTWNAQPGLYYGVESRTDLTAGNWEPVYGPVAAAGGSLSWTDTDSLRGEKYYRVLEFATDNIPSLAPAPETTQPKMALTQGRARSPGGLQTSVGRTLSPTAPPVSVSGALSLSAPPSSVSRARSPSAPPDTQPPRKKSVISAKQSPEPEKSPAGENPGMHQHRGSRVPAIFSGKRLQHPPRPGVYDAPRRTP